MGNRDNQRWRTCVLCKERFIGSQRDKSCKNCQKKTMQGFADFIRKKDLKGENNG